MHCVQTQLKKREGLRLGLLPGFILWNSSTYVTASGRLYCFCLVPAI